MKPVIHLLRAIQHVITRNRQQGSTTRLLEIAEKHQVYIVAASRDHARHFGPAGVSIQEIVRETDGHHPRALFFDTYGISYLCSRVLDQFEVDAIAATEVKQIHQSVVMGLESEIEQQKRNYQASQFTLDQRTREYQDLNKQFYQMREELYDAEAKLKARNSKITRITVKRRK